MDGGGRRRGLGEETALPTMKGSKNKTQLTVSLEGLGIYFFFNNKTLSNTSIGRYDIAPLWFSQLSQSFRDTISIKAIQKEKRKTELKTLELWIHVSLVISLTSVS